jgi:di/tricarboxylate transporter
MFGTLGYQELALIALILAIFVFRFLFPPVRIVRALFPAAAHGPKRTWREWTLSERLIVGIALLAFIVDMVRRSYHFGGMAGIGFMIGVVLVVVAVKGLLARSRAG